MGEGGGRGQSPAETLRRQLKGKGEVLDPKDAEEPILAPMARASLKEWLAEINMRAELKAAGLKPRTSALLFGPPGCGKTTYAHHLAARLGMPMLSVGAEHIVSPYVGGSSQNVGELFDTLAQVKVPVVLFVDEMEAIAPNRSKQLDGGNQNRVEMVSALLRRIEAFNGILIGATNLAGAIDPAIWRRFGMQITIDLPGDDERFAIMRRYLLPYEWHDEAFDTLCSLTQGASPALLRGLIEGIKRALVLGPSLRRPATDPAETIERIVLALQPPPGIDPPPLWAERGWDSLRAMPWPPTLAAPAGQGSVAA